MSTQFTKNLFPSLMTLIIIIAYKVVDYADMLKLLCYFQVPANIVYIFCHLRDLTISINLNVRLF